MAVDELLRNPRFEEWSGGFPTQWSRLATANVTYRRLQKLDPRDHPQRGVFSPLGSKASERDYIWDGPSGLRLEFSAAAAVDGWIIRQNNAAARGLFVAPGQRLAPVVTARCNVENNLLRVQVIGILGTTDTLYLIPDTEAVSPAPAVGTGALYPGRGGFRWTTVATNILLPLKTLWTSWGLQADVPLGVDSVSVRLSNGTAGAQVIDVGEVSLLERSYKIGGTG